MGNHSIDCKYCGVDERGYESHAEWCKESMHHMPTKEGRASAILTKYENVLTVSASRNLRNEIIHALSKHEELLRKSAPWSKELKPWFALTEQKKMKP